MELVEFTGDVEVIQKLGTFPNAEDGLTAEDLKKKFDEAPTAIKKYLNETLVPEVNRIGKNAGKPISVTITTVDGALTADKGYAELYAAHVAGQTVHCKLPDGSVLALATADENGLLFQGEMGRNYRQIIIKADGAVTLEIGSYVLQSELRDTYYVHVEPDGDGGYFTDSVMDDVLQACASDATVICRLELPMEPENLQLPLAKHDDSTAYFSTVFEGKEYLVTITADGVTVEISECGGGNSGGNVVQGSGLSATAKALLIAILRNGVFVSDQSASITALDAALASSGGNDDSGGSGDSGETQTITFAQTGSVLAISGVESIKAITQTGSVLALA